MTETERSGLLSQRTASPTSPIELIPNDPPNGKVDVKDFGEDTSDDSRQEKVLRTRTNYYLICEE